MLYRQEHPKPQFRRENWENLNGPWEFLIDHGNSGAEQGFFSGETLYPQTIQVPFCPESKLSGVEYKDFMTSVWYRRTITVTAQQLTGLVRLHFGAVDHKATIYVNGQKAGGHTGGYVSFWVDITAFLTEGENTLVVHAQDDTRDSTIPSGKQCEVFASRGCHYTRTTGIWQTVWLEYLPKVGVESVHFQTDPHAGAVTVQAKVRGAGQLRAEVFFAGKPVGSGAVTTAGEDVALTVQLAETHLWDLGQGNLYDVVLSYGEDVVHTYFGLRTISYRDKKFYLNGRSVFQRLVLDQGFFPDGLYTAPSDAELAADVDRAMAMGFNGARLHEKVFEERFLYHADRKGYLIWGEFPNWGLDITGPVGVYGILPQWLEEVERDKDHPSIVGWCPFNETWDHEGRKQYDGVLDLVYRATKAADPTRPCLDTSGNFHVITDIYDLHDYTQDPKEFAEHYAPLAETGSVTEFPSAFLGRQRYDGKLPFMVSEYGGIRWTDDKNGWGYGHAPQSPEEFLTRLKGLNDVLLDNEAMFGFCYTQLTDIEQEQNGLYTYDRKAKFPAEEIYPLFARKAAVEE